MKKAMMPAISIAALRAAAPAAVETLVRADAGGTEEMLKQVQAQLDRLNGDTKKTAENALAEAKKAGEVSAETKNAADQLLTAQNVLSDAVKNLTEQLEGVVQTNKDLAQSIAAGGGSSDPRQTMGQAVVAQADKLAAFVTNGARGSVSFGVANAITTAAGSAGGLIAPDETGEVVEMARRQLKILDLISRGTTASDVIKYAKQTLRTNAAAAVAEEGTYPASAYGWTKAEANVRKLGHITHISEEALADAAQLQTHIDTELRYGLDLEVETQILAGDGTGENLSGLITNATAFSAAAGLPNATRIDRLRLAILQLVLADYVADGIVLNPTDWADIDLLKDANGRFIFGAPGGDVQPRLWGKPVVESNSASAGEWLVGNFRMAATFYDRSEAEVLISSEHGTNFVDGMLTMKGTKRAALAVKRSAALVKGNFTFV